MEKLLLLCISLKILTQELKEVDKKKTFNKIDDEKKCIINVSILRT